MEDPVAYDGGNPIERASVSISQAIAARADQVVADHFESQAQATLSQWAALRRALDGANALIDELRAENGDQKARIGELVRANVQLSGSLEASLQREGEAKEQAGYLKGIMTSAASSLMEGMRPAQRPPGWLGELVRRTPDGNVIAPREGNQQ